jgi:hypothetical protein
MLEEQQRKLNEMIKENQLRADQIAKQKQIDDLRYLKEQRRKVFIEEEELKKAAELELLRQELERQKQESKNELIRAQNKSRDRSVGANRNGDKQCLPNGDCCANGVAGRWNWDTQQEELYCWGE